MSDSQPTAAEIEQEWEERKKQARLDNLAKAREANRLKREQVSFTIEPVNIPKAPVVQRIKVSKPPTREYPIQPVIAKKRTHAESISTDERVHVADQTESISSRILSHMGGFLLTLLSVTATAVIPVMLSAYKNQLTMGHHPTYPQARGLEQLAHRDDIFNDQSIFI